LRQILDYFSHDANALRPVYPDHGTTGQQGTVLAKAALEHLAAGDAEQAVRCTVEAMLAYCNCEMIGLRFEHGDEMRDLAERWETRTKAAVGRETSRRMGKINQREQTTRKLDVAVEYALGLIHSRISKTAAQKRAVEQAAKAADECAAKLIQGGMSKKAAKRKADRQHRIGLTKLREHWPKYLD
jgi:hypothetical protein